MPFEVWDRNEQPNRRYGDPRVRVETHPNGRTTITFTSATRDWLEVTKHPQQPGVQMWRQKQPEMKVSLLVTPEHDEFMIVRIPDDVKDPRAYEVSGLSLTGKGTAYISDYKLDESLGLLNGHYPVLLVENSGKKAVRFFSKDLIEFVPGFRRTPHRRSPRRPLPQQWR